MVTINLKHNFPQVAEALGELSDAIATKATVSAINKTLAQGRTAMIRAITAEFAIKASNVRAQIKVNSARFAKSALSAIGTLEAFGRRRGRSSRNVMLFGAKQVVGRQKKRVRFPTARGWVTKDVPIGGGVSVLIRRGGGRKLIPHAFIANKGRTVFIRTGKDRAIAPVETIDIPQMFNTRRLNEAVLRIILERFPRIFENEARFFVNRFSVNKGLTL
jgi:hypothetical protein